MSIPEPNPSIYSQILSYAQSPENQIPTQPTNTSTIDTILSLLGLGNNGSVTSPATASATPAASPTTNQGTVPTTAPVDFDPASIQSYAKQQIDQQFGGNPNEWNAFYGLLQRESGWNPNATNASSGAYGLGQFLDSTWQGTGYQKTNDPSTQINATIKYIKDRYGTPAKALDFWENVAPTYGQFGGSHWY